MSLYATDFPVQSVTYAGNTTNSTTFSYHTSFDGSVDMDRVEINGEIYVREKELTDLQEKLEERTGQAMTTLAQNEKLKQKCERLKRVYSPVHEQKEILHEALSDIKDMIDRNADALIGVGCWSDIFNKINHALAAASMVKPGTDV